MKLEGVFLVKINHVGSVRSKKKCVPFISEYSNCNEDNLCSGCSRCKCDSEGQWACQDVQECPKDDLSPDALLQEDEDIFDDALQMLEYDLNKKRHNIKLSTSPQVPAPHHTEQDDLLAPVINHQMKVDEAVASLSLHLLRSKRSTANKHYKRSLDKPSNNSSHNNTVNNYDAIDEINEETLKNSNLTGTLVAKKVDMMPPLTGSRRSSFPGPTNKALQIEYSHPKTYNQITDNKIETVEQDNKFDSSHENLKTVLSNYTQNTKVNDLSKIVVNELKQGSEIIGDASATPVSNITFTSENDTLTAMAFIAGNLLNKLWNLERDATLSSIETNGLKHEKISDLLELFKEPLNMRQETFLKNALEQLSNAIDINKDAKNISICETINESKKLETGNSDEETTEKMTTRKNSKADDNNPTKNKEEEDFNKTKLEIEFKQKEATIKAMAEINNVLELIKKFEYVQGNISKLQHGPKLDLNHTLSSNKNNKIGTELTKAEKKSFNMFGKLLEKITKLILPKSNNKKITKGIKRQNFLKGYDNLKTKFKAMYNVDLTNMTVTAKDKLILDYLTHVENNPGCLLNNKQSEDEAIPRVEGNILLNLSEFFKLKSFSDLIKLLEPEKTKAVESPNETRTQNAMKDVQEKNVSSGVKSVDSFKFNSTKEKLKAHLKAIMEDLVEIQSAKGVDVKYNFEIADALPCFYNLLKADSEKIVKKEEKSNPVKKIASIFQRIKHELKVTPSRRHTGDEMTERPKSAVVWERLVKNLNENYQLQTRRSSISKIPKSYDAIKKMMERIENGSSTYKHQALLVDVPVSGKLILLRALEQEVQAAINIISEMSLSFDNLTKLPTDQFSELAEFVGNMERGIKLSARVNEKIKSAPRNLVSTEFTTEKNKLKKKPSLRNSDYQPGESDNMRINRIQIVNQLIRNRMEMFLKLKANSGSDLKKDLTYIIAQRILYNLDAGNYKLANELFRLFVLQKPNEPTNDNYVVASTSKYIDKPMRRLAQPQKEAGVLLENPNIIKAKQMNWVTQDHLIKQLLNIKNMGL